MNKKSLCLVLITALVGLCQVQFLQAMVEAFHEPVVVEHGSGEPVGQDSAAVEREREQKERAEHVQEQQHLDFIDSLKNNLPKSQGGKGGKAPVVKSGGTGEGSGAVLGQGVAGDDPGTVSMKQDEKEALVKLAQGDHEAFARKIQEQQHNAQEGQVDQSVVQEKVKVVKEFRKKLIETLGKDFFKKSESLKKTVEYKEINERINQFYLDCRDTRDPAVLRKKMNQILDQIRGKKGVAFDSYDSAQKDAQGKLGFLKRMFTTAVPKGDAVTQAGEVAKGARKAALENAVDSMAKKPEAVKKALSSVLTRIRDIETKQKMIQEELDKEPSFLSRSPEKKYKELRDQLAKDKEKLEVDKTVIQEKTRLDLATVKELEEQSFKSGEHAQDNQGQHAKIRSDFQTTKARLDLYISAEDRKPGSEHAQFYDGLDEILKPIRKQQELPGNHFYVKQELVDEINEKLLQLKKPVSFFNSGKVKEKVRLQEEILHLAKQAKEQFDSDMTQPPKHADFYNELDENLKPLGQDPTLVKGGLYLRQELLDRINENLKELQSPRFPTLKGTPKEEARKEVQLKKEILDLVKQAKEKFLADKANGVRFARYEQPRKEGNVPAEMVFMKNPGDGENKNQWGFYTNRLDQHTTETSRAFYEEINKRFEDKVRTSKEIKWVLDEFEKPEWQSNRNSDEIEETQEFLTIVKKINKNLESMSQPGMTPKQIEGIKKDLLKAIDNLHQDLRDAYTRSSRQNF